MAEAQAQHKVGIVLLHGPMANATHWRWVIPGLAATHRVVVPDLPGHGVPENGDAIIGDLARIAIPTTLIWGRHDRATPLP